MSAFEGWPGRSRRQAAALVVAFGLLLVALEVRDRQLEGSGRLPGALVLTAALLVGLYLATRAPSLPAFAALSTVSVGLTALAPNSASGSVYWVAGAAAFRLPARTGLIVVAATSAADLAVLYAVRGPAVLGQLPLPALALVLAYLGFYSVRRRREQEVRAVELEREAARAEERARLAREIHDVLAHTLSAMSVQLDLAATLMRQHADGSAALQANADGSAALQANADSSAALQAVDRARALAREGLRDARRAVSTLRGEELPGPELLGRLAADFERDTTVPCRVELPAELPVLSSEERVAVYRTAQEALINVRRHARAHAVLLRLAPAGSGVELSVVNDGPAAAQAHAPAGGYGLTGMRERAELLGGRLEAGPLAGEGFCVRLWLPVT